MHNFGQKAIRNRDANEAGIVESTSRTMIYRFGRFRAKAPQSSGHALT